MLGVVLACEGSDRAEAFSPHPVPIPLIEMGLAPGP